MKSRDQIAGATHQVNAIHEAVDTACRHIAPTWPLDQSIAVNPYWGFIDYPIHKVGLDIESYSGSRLTMPRSFYRDRWKEGLLRSEHLQEALKRSESGISMMDLQDELDRESPSVPRVPVMTSIVDLRRDLVHGMSVSDFVTHNLSQHCAAYFDRCQSSWETPHKKGLYRSWLDHAAIDMSPRLLMGINNLRHHARSLPENPLAMIELSLHALPIPPQEWTNYFTALLMSINGWSSWCAFERWQANLAGKDDDQIIQLLAIRLAWEHFVFVHLLQSDEPLSWKHGWEKLREWREHSESHPSADWVFQEALEISFQSELCESLSYHLTSPDLHLRSLPAVQAVFCIDVRSEVFRRSLEACSDSIQTLGFAGFFGLPISYTPLGTSAERPQLPGLLAPKLRVSESTGSERSDQRTINKRQRSLHLKLVWKDFRSSANSMFTFVESCGLFYAASLLKSTLRRPNLNIRVKDVDPHRHKALRPCISRSSGHDQSSVDNLCDLVAAILTSMSLTTSFARLVLLVGHGSQTANNPHAAGLNCGACGGQTGEVNARVFAGLLNDPAIRTGLGARGITIPATTHVLAALHNTTTDEIELFDTDSLPHSHASDLEHLQAWLKHAGDLARTERAASLGIHANKAPAEQTLLSQFQLRSRDWSQVRPEWGLANNAAFLIAPRTRSRGLDLHGRVFLHEYQSASDPKGSVLESIMTAPMLVTNWINMQYYASTVDNRQYGSGNKVLHNVVGGRLGVFEGNGGDLRIGLPLQSLHDGRTLRHTPLRLSVFIEARQSAISDIILKHEVVRRLVHNGWVHIFHITPQSETISRYRNGIWEPIQLNAFTAAEQCTEATTETYA